MLLQDKRRSEAAPASAGFPPACGDVGDAKKARPAMAGAGSWPSGPGGIGRRHEMDSISELFSTCDTPAAPIPVAPIPVALALPRPAPSRPALSWTALSWAGKPQRCKNAWFGRQYAGIRLCEALK